jgi:superfamily II DNA or RNA helicase
MGEWFYSTKYSENVLLVDRISLFGRDYAVVFVPSIQQVERVPVSDLSEKQPSISYELIQFLTGLGKLHAMLNEGVLLSQTGTTVIPLPHQIACLSRVIFEGKPRYLIADEVGLGKTIEAGLIFKELKLRGLVERVLVLCPKSLIMQWVAEMKIHFNEDFRPILTEELSATQSIFRDANIWKMFPQAVCSYDTVKPRSGRGWTKEKIEEYNRHRFENLISAGWDLVIIDEAHKVAGATEGVARNKLARELCKATPFVLLLTATPHQGKRDGFLRLMRLLDEEQFPNEEALTLENIAPYVIRTEKRKAVDSNGKPLFKDRLTYLERFRLDERKPSHRLQKELYDRVTDYVISGYRAGGTHGKLYLIILQKILASSTRALRKTLEKRLSVLSDREDITTHLIEEDEVEEALEDAPLRELFLNEREKLQELIDLAKRCENSGPDARAEELERIIYKVRREEGDPSLKVIVFTEFIATQEMLKEFLTSRGFTVATINGHNTLEERIEAQRFFREKADVLVSTEAGGEGLNLQFCHVVINYDLPWNPMRLEQRIGRVDRIGQTNTVKAYNLVLEGSVEDRIQQLLEEKLKNILKDFGVDKISDVLDSEIGERIFSKIYSEAAADPDKTPKLLEDFMRELEAMARERMDVTKLISLSLNPEEEREKIRRSRKFEEILEKTVLSFVKHRGGKVSKGIFGWNILWPDGTLMEDVSFTSDGTSDSSKILGVDHPKIREIIELSHPVTHLKSSALVKVKGIPSEVSGLWSLWMLRIDFGKKTKIHYIPVFTSKDAETYTTTANRIWEKLSEGKFSITSGIERDAYPHKNIAEELAKDFFERDVMEEKQKIESEYTRKIMAIEAKRKAIEKIGIKNIRESRLRELEIERMKIERDYKIIEEPVPELYPVLVLEVKGDG